MKQYQVKLFKFKILKEVLLTIIPGMVGYTIGSIGIPYLTEKDTSYLKLKLICIIAVSLILGIVMYISTHRKHNTKKKGSNDY